MNVCERTADKEARVTPYIDLYQSGIKAFMDRIGYTHHGENKIRQSQVCCRH